MRFLQTVTKIKNSLNALKNVYVRFNFISVYLKCVTLNFA